MNRIFFVGMFFSLSSLSATVQKEDVQLLKDCISRDFGMFSEGAENLKNAQNRADFRYAHAQALLQKRQDEASAKYQSDYDKHKDNNLIEPFVRGFAAEREERLNDEKGALKEEHHQRKVDLDRLDCVAAMVAFKVKEALEKEDIYFGGWTEPKMYLLLTKRSWIIKTALNNVDQKAFEKVLNELDSFIFCDPQVSMLDEFGNTRNMDSLIEHLKIKIAEQKEKSYWIPFWKI